jgi:hypothetical protein
VVALALTLAIGGLAVGTSVASAEPPPSPTAVDDSATVVEDSGANPIDVLANDSNPGGGPMEIIWRTHGAHGTVLFTDGGTELTYTPLDDYCGPDSFTYTLNGGSTATVTVTVICVDDPPVALDNSFTLSENSGATELDVFGTDYDVDGGPMEVVSKTDASHASVAIASGGDGLIYTPAADYCGPDSFTYTLNGGSTATVWITVTCIHDPPVAVEDEATVAEDSPPTAIDVLANDTDDDGDPKQIVSKRNGFAGVVTITGQGSGLTYQPAENYCGPDSFTYTLNGGSTARVFVSVFCVDDPSIPVEDEATVVEDSPPTTIDVLANDTDIDGGPKSTIEAATDGAHGSVAITGGGSALTYQPDPNYCGPDSFSYEVGGFSAGVWITVTCVDDPPTAVNDSGTVLENSGARAIDVLANDTDIDGGPKSIASKTNGAHGTVAVTGGGSGLTYQPEPGYCGPDSFTYTLNGGSTASVSITVTCTPPPEEEEEEEEEGGGGGSGDDGGEGSTQTIIQSPGPTGPVVNVTSGIGVVSAQRRPRIVIKGSYALITLTCRATDRGCAGTVAISASIPSAARAATMRKVVMVKAPFHIGPSHSALIKAKITKRGLEALGSRQAFKGVTAEMSILDSGNGERAQVQVTLVRSPRAS